MCSLRAGWNDDTIQLALPPMLPSAWQRLGLPWWANLNWSARTHQRLKDILATTVVSWLTLSTAVVSCLTGTPSTSFYYPPMKGSLNTIISIIPQLSWIHITQMGWVALDLRKTPVSPTPTGLNFRLYLESKITVPRVYANNPKLLNSYTSPYGNLWQLYWWNCFEAVCFVI